MLVELERSYGQNLRRMRKERAFSQEELAFRAEVHRTEISLLERGKRDPGVNTTLRLAGALGVAPGELLTGATFVPSEDGREGRFTYEAAKPRD
ncbi:MAG TPA: helix-turn-helix transcriptional regulator [Solirubrobacterales bacterium]